jgi:hypothetical protein
MTNGARPAWGYLSEDDCRRLETDLNAWSTRRQTRPTAAGAIS